MLIKLPLVTTSRRQKTSSLASTKNMQNVMQSSRNSVVWFLVLQGKKMKLIHGVTGNPVAILVLYSSVNLWTLQSESLYKACLRPVVIALVRSVPVEMAVNGSRINFWISWKKNIYTYDNNNFDIWRSGKTRNKKLEGQALSLYCIWLTLPWCLLVFVNFENVTLEGSSDSLEHCQTELWVLGLLRERGSSHCENQNSASTDPEMRKS